MANTRNHPILDYLRRVLGEPGGGVGDADLLRRFVAERDEAAFELLLWRHAAMVLHVCRQVLGDADAADDAFQATFLVFVRKAGSISRREALGSWLYRVAYRIALKARARLKTPTAAPEELDRLAAPPETEDAEKRELRRIVCEEVNRLPANYRAAVVACFFEGKTHEEAAKQLGWPRGTVAGRLARARELLHRRLVRRGVTLTMGALVTALAVRTAQAALAGLVDSVIHTARLMAAGQATAAVVSPHVAALAKGALQAMYWTKTKIAVIVLFLASLGGAGVSLLATQEQIQSGTANFVATAKPSEQPGQPPIVGEARAESPEVVGEVRAEPAQASADDEDATTEDQPPEEIAPDDASKLARDMARSRLNLKRLAVAMQKYAADNQGCLPLGGGGKALWSWRVELLPYLGERALRDQIHGDEPWDGPHNRKLLSKMPAVFAPPGIKTRQPYMTYYQVFVSVGPFAEGAVAGAMRGGMPGMPGGRGRPQMQPQMQQQMQMQRGMMGGAPPMPPNGGMPTPPSGTPRGRPAPEAAEHFATAFIKGMAPHFPAFITDGTSNTILIVEAGNPVPWTKPEDLHYADDEPLPELGGLFPNVFHAALADGSVHTLNKNCNKKQLRLAISANDNQPFDFSKFEARSRPRAGGGGDRATLETWQQKNAELRKELELLREQIRLIKEEREVERELAGEDPRVVKLKDEHDMMQAQLKKLRAEIESLKKDIRQPRKP